jgi:hypothetical protein
MTALLICQNICLLYRLQIKWEIKKNYILLQYCPEIICTNKLTKNMINFLYDFQQKQVYILHITGTQRFVENNLFSDTKRIL